MRFPLFHIALKAIRCGKRWTQTIVFCLLFISSQVYSQSCDCPIATSCGNCSGGLTSITLRYDGLLPALISGSDRQELLFFQIVAPGETFTLQGADPVGRFVGSKVTLTVGLIEQTTINTFCNASLYVNTIFGSFTLVGGVSQAGGSLCCSPTDTDLSAPEILNYPSDTIVAITDQRSSIAVDWIEPVAEDECTVLSFTSTHEPGDLFPIGTTPVTYTATDKFNNVSTHSFNVIIKDLAPPVISGCIIIDITATADAKGKAVVTWKEPTASDNSSKVTLTRTHKPGDLFPIGTTEVTYTAKDNSGNTSTCKFKVIVEDKLAPVISNCPADIEVKLQNGCATNVDWTEPSSADPSGVSSLTSTHHPGDQFPVGLTEVVYTAVDTHGNKSTCTFSVTVINGYLPVISHCPANIEAIADATGFASVNWSPPVATLGCGDIAVSSTHQPGDRFPVGSTEVIYEASDDRGNKVTCAFNVIIAEGAVELNVTQIITPDGDGYNDLWTLPDLEKYTDNKVVIVDRWGNEIFKASGYDNSGVVWNGENGKGILAPTGTYFYTITVKHGSLTVEKRGFIELIR